jgi:hypothetical protein
LFGISVKEFLNPMLNNVTFPEIIISTGKGVRVLARPGGLAHRTPEFRRQSRKQSEGFRREGSSV